MGICPCHGDNLEKSGIIPDGVEVKIFTKAPADREEPAAYQLVGEVMAHQGYDG